MLTLDEQEDISRGIASGLSIREIAKGLQQPVSTVSREVARHGGRPLYRASEADHQAWESALRLRRIGDQRFQDFLQKNAGRSKLYKRRLMNN